MIVPRRPAVSPALAVGDRVFVRLWVPMHPGRFGVVVEIVYGAYMVEFGSGDVSERCGYDRDMLLKI